MYPISVAARCMGAACLPVLVVLLILRPHWLQCYGRRLSRRLTTIGDHPVRFAAAVAVGTIFLSASISCISFWPIPSVHDEFAYVLTGDTFANGRLTNPQHPFADHFTSWHIIQSPSYQSKYPPGQGVALALGQKVFDNQLVGVWISLALALATTTWAMFQWLPRRWAVYASLLIVLNPHIHLRWGQSYWGGAVALCGGALLVGALGRLKRKPGLGTGIAAGMGLVILAASRPFEGLLMAIPICLFTCWILVRRFNRSQIAVMISSCIVLIVGALMLAQYNRSVTGNWRKMPYRVWSEQQGEALDRMITPSVIPLKHVSTSEATVTSNSQEVPDDWRVAEVARMMSERSADAFRFNRDKLHQLNEFYLQTILRLPLLALPWMFCDRWRSVLIVAIAFVMAGSCTHLSAGHPHYIAGLATALLIVVTLCIRKLETIRIQERRVGPIISPVILSCWILMSATTFAADVIERPREPRLQWAMKRASIERKLGGEQTQQVIFVEYLPHHNIHQEWVYNGANIDSQPVIWANDLGESHNEALVRYLRNRNETNGEFTSVHAWHATIGVDSVTVENYAENYGEI